MTFSQCPNHKESWGHSCALRSLTCLCAHGSVGTLSQTLKASNLGGLAGFSDIQRVSIHHIWVWNEKSLGALGKGDF